MTISAEALVEPALASPESFVLAIDLRKAAATLSPLEARFLVDYYYQAQKDRIRTGNQVAAAKKVGEPHEVLSWYFDRQRAIEGSLKAALLVYVKEHKVGRWMLAIHGIGPVIAAGLMAHIDIEKAPTVGHIWRFAGLDAETQWLGQGKAAELVSEVMGDAKRLTEEHVEELCRRSPMRDDTTRRLATDSKTGSITKKSITDTLARKPWNARLKTLTWKLSGSFVKFRASPKDFYGKLYDQRKALEMERNAAHAFRDQCEHKLATTNIKDPKTRQSYESGLLPDGRIDLRARRWAVKIFLSHLHHVWYDIRFKTAPPRPFSIEHLGHAHYIAPPNWPMTDESVLTDSFEGEDEPTAESHD
jgi:hypothetical protein